MWTYDNPKFLKGLSFFFGFGVFLNGFAGLYFNALMLAILSYGCYRLYKIYNTSRNI